MNRWRGIGIACDSFCSRLSCIYLPIDRSIHPSIFLFIYRSIYPSIDRSHASPLDAQHAPVVEGSRDEGGLVGVRGEGEDGASIGKTHEHCIRAGPRDVRVRHWNSRARPFRPPPPELLLRARAAASWACLSPRHRHRRAPPRHLLPLIILLRLHTPRPPCHRRVVAASCLPNPRASPLLRSSARSRPRLQPTL